MKRKFYLGFISLLSCGQLLIAQLAPLQEKAILVKRVIELKHYSPKPIDDSFSVATFNTLLNTADSRRLLFTASEYKQLEAYRLMLDDELSGKKWGFFDQFQSLYKRSLQRADSIIAKLLQQPLDLSVKESIAFSQENTNRDFPTDVPSLVKRWTKYLKYKILSQAFEYVEDSAETVSLKAVLAKREPVIREKVKKRQLKGINRLLNYPAGYTSFVTEFYLDAIARSFDPHTNYFSPEGKEEFKTQVSAEGYFFGIEFEENEKGQIVVETITPGGPAWKSGEINKGDQLMSLLWEGKEVQDVETAELEDVYEIMDQSTHDQLLFRFRKADGTMSNVMLRKEKLENEENIVKSFVLNGEKKIGYILLPGFYTEWESETGSSCANDVAKEILKLRKENIEGLILDVRYNGGGSLGETLEMAGIFIDEGPFIAQKNREGKLITLKDPNRGTIYDGPLALMVNGYSASASEALAGILQDYNRGVIIGSNTYGKATMQQIFSLDTVTSKPAALDNNKDAVKITVGKLFRMNGSTAQLSGVMPDIVLPDAFEGLETGERFQNFPLPADTVKKNNYYKPFPGLPVSELAKRSAARVEGNIDFTIIRKLAGSHRNIVKEELRPIPLDTEGFEKWARSDMDEQEKNELSAAISTEDSKGKFSVENHAADKKLIQNDIHARELNDSWLKNLAEDFYLEEAFNIVTDLINLQKSQIKN